VAPGFFPTEMTDQYLAGYLERMLEARVPMGRAGQPGECTAAVVCLASDAASYVSEVILPVDGGPLTS
jgi:NAD(P)-dependent dehydrogenase (short-subunit alcohol dehydrogenase family)